MADVLPPAGKSPEYAMSARLCWKLRVEGGTPTQIAEYMNLGYGAVTERIKWWAEEGSKSESESGESIVQQQRQLTFDRYEYYISLYTERVKDGDDAAVTILRGLLADERKLLGLDSPAKISVEQRQTRYTIDGVDPEMLK